MISSPSSLPRARLIALDEHGEILTTMEMYDKVNAWRLEGHFNATSFVIGGANGLDERVKARAQGTLETLLTHFTPPICTRFALRAALSRGPNSARRTLPSSVMEVATHV